MKALVLQQDKTLTYTDVPNTSGTKPSRPVTIKVAAAGICGSDIHRGFEGGAYHYPLIMGHEFAGTVETAPADCGYARGDRVTVFPLIPCRSCLPCQTGDFAQCVNYDYLGSRCDGGFAEYVDVPTANLFRVPDHVDIVHAAMTEPCAVALHGVRKLTIRAGDTGVVFGGGPIGNIVAQWLRINGCGEVIVVEIDPEKLAIAAAMGFTTVNPRSGDPVAAIAKLTGGGADRVVEACGLPLTFLQAVRSAGRFGEVLFLGNINGDFTIPQKDFSDILRKEITIRGTWNSKVTPAGKDDWSTVLQYMDKQLQVAPLISHTPPLSDGVRMFDAVVGRKEPFNKVIFRL